MKYKKNAPRKISKFLILTPHITKRALSLTYPTELSNLHFHNIVKH